MSNPSALSRDTLYIPARAYISWTLDFGFASEQETVKMGTPSVYAPRGTNTVLSASFAAPGSRTRARASGTQTKGRWCTMTS